MLIFYTDLWCTALGGNSSPVTTLRGQERGYVDRLSALAYIHTINLQLPQTHFGRACCRFALKDDVDDDLQAECSVLLASYSAC